MRGQVSKSLGFIAILSVVIGNQIGSGAFNNPVVLSEFGYIGLLGLILSGIGAILLSLVFARLSKHFPVNGGPHTYISAAFGRKAGFFIAWIYWIVSWLSNAVLLNTMTSYLSLIFGEMSSWQAFFAQISVLIMITALNVAGIKTAGKSDIALTIFKTTIFVVLPIVFMFCVKAENFAWDHTNYQYSTSTICRTILLSFFGFIGVESATNATENTKNPDRTIPLAIVTGTTIVAIVYLLNNISIIGVLGFDTLKTVDAPYAVAIDKIMENINLATHYKGGTIIAIISVLACFGTLNSWTFTSGQIAYVSHKEGFFNASFGKTNKNGSPYNAILLSAAGMIACLMLGRITIVENLLTKILEISSSIFLYIYLLCCVSFLAMLRKLEKKKSSAFVSAILSILSLAFCSLVLISDILSGDGISTLIITTILIFTGIPVYLKNKKTILQRVQNV